MVAVVVVDAVVDVEDVDELQLLMPLSLLLEDSVLELVLNVTGVEVVVTAVKVIDAEDDELVLGFGFFMTLIVALVVVEVVVVGEF